MSTAKQPTELDITLNTRTDSSHYLYGHYSYEYHLCLYGQYFHGYHLHCFLLNGVKPKASHYTESKIPTTVIDHVYIREKKTS